MEMYIHYKSLPQGKDLHDVIGELNEVLEDVGAVCGGEAGRIDLELEDGVIRFPLLRDLLEETGYQGTAVIEQDMFQATAGEAFQTARKNLQYLRRIRMI